MANDAILEESLSNSILDMLFLYSSFLKLWAHLWLISSSQSHLSSIGCGMFCHLLGKASFPYQQNKGSTSSKAFCICNHSETKKKRWSGSLSLKVHYRRLGGRLFTFRTRATSQWPQNWGKHHCTHVTIFIH